MIVKIAKLQETKEELIHASKAQLFEMVETINNDIYSFYVKGNGNEPRLQRNVINIVKK